MKVYKGNILTIDGEDSVQNYLVEDQGKIIFTGMILPEKFQGAELIDLENKTLCPTFADTHQHFASFALFNAGLNVMEASSNTEILDMVREFVSKSPEKFLIAFGASPYSVAERRLVSRQELDRVTDDRPFFMVKYDGHACIVNTALLKKVQAKVETLRGYHPDTGEMNQEAFFAVSDFVTNSISVPTLVRNMQKAMDFEAGRGIGMVHTVSGVGFPFNMDISIENWLAKSAESGFQLRVFPQSMDISVAKKRKLPRTGGCFKCALDGCFGSQDAAMKEPYANDPENKGVLYYTDDQVMEFCRKANRAGLQIEMHAIGDRAFDQASRALKAALDDFPREDHRHGIIHACLPTEEGMEICSRYHIQLPMQIAFDNWRQEPEEYTTALLGKDRGSRLNPVKTLMEKGMVISFGSDGPCTTPDPISWLYKAVNHSNPAEAVTIRQALRMATLNGYWTSFDEGERGSLETGKIADMVVLSENPYTMNPGDLMRLKVEKTILSGEEYIPQQRSWPFAILRGMLHG